VPISPDLCNSLEEIAQRKKVSLTWVLLEATEKYHDGDLPLLATEEYSSRAYALLIR
jgi:hypothetical protein